MFALLPVAALADELPALIAYSCDASRSAFFVQAEEEMDPDLIPARELALRSDRHVQKIPWRSLVKLGPQTNGRGDPLRNGTKTLTKTCGRITIRFQSGYLNDNIQGQYGALEFPVVEVLLGKRTLLKPTALATCSVLDTFPTYFGACPAKWAFSVRTQQASANVMHVTVTRKFSDSADVVRQSVDALTFHQ